MDPLTGFLDEALAQVTKKFPQASQQLTTQLHKQNFLSQEDEIEEDVYSEDQPEIFQRLKPEDKLGRPKSGVLSSFNNLRQLMNTKKQAVSAAKGVQRPLTAAQSIANLGRASQIRYVATAAGSGYKCSMPDTQRNDMFRTSQQFYNKSAQAYYYIHPSRPQKVLLHTASTFRMTYDNKVAYPSFVRKPVVNKPRLLVSSRDYQEDSGVEQMKQQVDAANDTFKVGLKDVKVIEPESSKRPPSPNPTRAWAAKRKIDLDKRNDEIKNRLQPLPSQH